MTSDEIAQVFAEVPAKGWISAEAYRKYLVGHFADHFHMDSHPHPFDRASFFAKAQEVQS